MYNMIEWPHMRPYATIEKRVGETPLQATERLRASLSISSDTALAYAGRLDPMASGTLLVLIGNECKHQEKYHALDKAYEFSVLFGVSSDSGDILGLISPCQCPHITISAIRGASSKLVGDIEFPYPHFSSKTVKGKPLHTWTLEHRLNEITIPIKKSRIYSLTCIRLEEITSSAVYQSVLERIELIPKVTETSKDLGRDFRRHEVRKTWQTWYDQHPDFVYQLATFTCTASSGTYMRTLAGEIAKLLNTCGLAYSIHRTRIGTYRSFAGLFGLWTKRF